MSTGAIAGGVIAVVVVIFLCIGGAVFAIVYIQRRKKHSKRCSVTCQPILIANNAGHKYSDSHSNA